MLPRRWCCVVSARCMFRIFSHRYHIRLWSVIIFCSIGRTSTSPCRMQRHRRRSIHTPSRAKKWPTSRPNISTIRWSFRLFLRTGVDRRRWIEKWRSRKSGKVSERMHERGRQLRGRLRQVLNEIIPYVWGGAKTLTNWINLYFRI